MEPQIRFCTSADGTRIAFAAYGEQRGLPIVLVTAWSHVLDAFWTHPQGWKFKEAPARHRRIVEYDRRGIGASQREVSDVSLEAQVGDLGAVVDAAGFERFDLISWFDGGPIAIAYAAQYPDRVSRLVLCSPFSVASGGTRVGDGAAQIARLIRTDWSLARRAMATVQFGDEDLQRWYSRTIKDSMSQEAAARHWEEFVVGLDITSELPQVRAPTLVLHFSEAHWVPAEASRTVATSIPDAQLVPIEGTVDVFCDRFDDLVLPFLDAGRQTQPSELPSGTAIILFADIVDSTALTERLGDAAFREWARELDGSLRSIIREAGGTPIEGKLLGDGVLATFASARQAIEAALRCGAAGDECGLPLHLGLHAGDVISEEGNVYGGAVNIAARIASSSAPGEVLASQTVRDLARTSAGVTFDDRGEQSLKGVGEPVRVWAVRNA